jgi:MraZ protein
LAFRGHYEHSLDAKNRLSIPAKFRAELSRGVVLAKWLEPCVTIWTPQGFEEFTASVLPPLNPLSSERRKLTRFFAGYSFDAELDGSGRVTLAPTLIAHAGIEKDVVVVGNLDHLEVWERARWLEEQRELDTKVIEVAEGLGHPS